MAGATSRGRGAGESGDVEGVPRPDGWARRHGPFDRPLLQDRGTDHLACRQVGRGDARDFDVGAAGDPVDEHGGTGRLVAVLGVFVLFGVVFAGYGLVFTPIEALMGGVRTSSWRRAAMARAEPPSIGPISVVDLS